MKLIVWIRSEANLIKHFTEIALIIAVQPYYEKWEHLFCCHCLVLTVDTFVAIHHVTLQKKKEEKTLSFIQHISKILY